MNCILCEEGATTMIVWTFTDEKGEKHLHTCNKHYEACLRVAKEMGLEVV
jgi:hypothetical protein